VLVATVILTITLVSIAELMAITIRMQMLGRNQTSATRLAQDKIDELMSTNFADPALSLGGNLTGDDPNHFDSDDQNLYKRRWLVAAFPDDPIVVAGDPADQGMLRVLTVRVTPIVTDLRGSAPAEIVTVIRCWPC
jgi:hypothetical protein